MYFVIGAVHYALRLSALESIVISFFADESLCSFSRRRKVDMKNSDSPVPLTGRQPKPDKKPTTDQMPKESGSVARQQHSLMASD